MRCRIPTSPTASSAAAESLESAAATPPAAQIQLQCRINWHNGLQTGGDWIREDLKSSPTIPVPVRRFDQQLGRRPTASIVHPVDPVCGRFCFIIGALIQIRINQLVPPRGLGSGVVLLSFCLSGDRKTLPATENL